MLGYLEQTAATNLVKALTAVGNFKPKYPFLTNSGAHICNYPKHCLHPIKNII
jgi:hypothetical protein